MLWLRVIQSAEHRIELQQKALARDRVQLLGEMFTLGREFRDFDIEEAALSLAHRGDQQRSAAQSLVSTCDDNRVRGCDGAPRFGNSVGGEREIFELLR